MLLFGHLSPWENVHSAVILPCYASSVGFSFLFFSGSRNPSSDFHSVLDRDLSLLLVMILHKQVSASGYILYFFGVIH